MDILILFNENTFGSLIKRIYILFVPNLHLYTLVHRNKMSKFAKRYFSNGRLRISGTRTWKGYQTPRILKSNCLFVTRNGFAINVV